MVLGVLYSTTSVGEFPAAENSLRSPDQQHMETDMLLYANIFISIYVYCVYDAKKYSFGWGWQVQVMQYHVRLSLSM